jgi:hypothetical protein
VELRQAAIAACNLANALKHGVAVHFELPIGKGVARQRVETLPLNLGASNMSCA